MPQSAPALLPVNDRIKTDIENASLVTDPRHEVAAFGRHGIGERCEQGKHVVVTPGAVFRPRFEGGVSDLFVYRGELYPNYIKEGNACQHIAVTALHFCRGKGLDIGAGRWPLPDAEPVELTQGKDGNGLPDGEWDYIFSSHCLEHLVNPIAALEHWQTRLRRGGTLFLYLPHPDMTYWQPQHCRKHLHTWQPAQMAQILRDLGFVDVIHGERDLAWSFAVVGFRP